MSGVEKTVFISYRRKDISWALAVYQYLTSQEYDVFFDYTSLRSGDFEEVIISNIRARAHFVLILTPAALDRCNEPGDWLRREIETAVDEKRNIIPLFFDGFRFDSPSVVEKLTGKLGAIKRYNGLDTPPGYFIEAMERLTEKYLDVPLDAVIHPFSTEVGRIVKEQQDALNQALEQKRDDLNRLIKPTEKRFDDVKQTLDKRVAIPHASVNKHEKRISLFLLYSIPISILLCIVLGILGINYLSRTNDAQTTPAPSQTLSSPQVTVDTPTLTPQEPVVTYTPTVTVPTLSPSSIGSSIISDKDGMTLLSVPASEFTMGYEAEDAYAVCQSFRSDCMSDWFIDEEPPHSVYIDAFWIDQSEVTNAMFARFLSDRANQIEDSVTWYHPGEAFSHIQQNGDLWQVDVGYENHPVVEVSWYGARAYCNWVDRRLPSEAEWEKAAGWDDANHKKNIYSWGDTINCQLANYGNCVMNTTNIRSFEAGKSHYGLYDMTGNVWEWVADWYERTYYQISPRSNPLGPAFAEKKVLRGGSWHYDDFSVRISARGSARPSTTDNNLGFRCAR